MDNQDIERVVSRITRQAHPSDLGTETSNLEDTLRTALLEAEERGNAQGYAAGYRRGVDDAQKILTKNA